MRNQIKKQAEQNSQELKDLEQHLKSLLQEKTDLAAAKEAEIKKKERIIEVLNEEKENLTRQVGKLVILRALETGKPILFLVVRKLLSR